MARGDFITCFGNDGGVLADARLVAEAADVFAEDAKGVLVAHDQVRHGAAGPAVVLVDREPPLMCERDGQRSRRTAGEKGRGRGSKRFRAEAEIPISWRISYPQHPRSSSPPSCRFMKHNNHDGIMRLCRYNLRTIMKVHRTRTDAGK